MKAYIIYPVFFIACILTFFVLISAAPVPEGLIQGEWKELKWEYETFKKGNNVAKESRLIPEEVKQKIGQHLVIHTAETWTFLPDHKLLLRKGNEIKTVEWIIKGRGNVLQLRYNENSVENYSITRLSDNMLQLNFDTDVQARGIAKLTFARTN